MSHVSREIRTRQCHCIIFTTVCCRWHSAWHTVEISWLKHTRKIIPSGCDYYCWPMRGARTGSRITLGYVYYDVSDTRSCIVLLLWYRYERRRAWPRSVPVEQVPGWPRDHIASAPRRNKRSISSCSATRESPMTSLPAKLVVATGGSRECRPGEQSVSHVFGIWSFVKVSLVFMAGVAACAIQDATKIGLFHVWCVPNWKAGGARLQILLVERTPPLNAPL